MTHDDRTETVAATRSDRTTLPQWELFIDAYCIFSLLPILSPSLSFFSYPPLSLSPPFSSPDGDIQIRGGQRRLPEVLL